VFPFGVHVDSGTCVGGRIPSAREVFSARQRKMAKLARAAMVYTPQVLLQGQDFRQWGTPAFEQAVAKINARTAKARISLLLDARQKDAFLVEAEAQLLDGLPQT